MLNRILALFIALLGAYVHTMSDEIKLDIMLNTYNGQKEFAIVVPTHNNSRFCIRNLESVAHQDYENYHVYIVDDGSTDDTYKKIDTYIEEHKLQDNITLIHNEKRMGAAANYYTIINAIPGHVIVLNVDGDDFLAHEQVLTKLNEVYGNQNIWMTYGQFRQYPSQEIGFCKPIAKRFILEHNYRDSEWLATHLRTYYAWLFHHIRVQDMCYEGEFLPMCADRAIVYPLLEMCAGHFRCIDEVLYIYNVSNPIADMRKDLTLQQKMCRYIRSLPAYEPLDSVQVLS